MFGGADPILACHENRIVRIREFRFEDYVTEAWNESLNASWYSSKEAAKKIEENVAVLAAQHDDFRADPDTNLCHKLVEHYGVYAAHVLNPVCIRAGSPSAICGERLLQ